MSLEIRLDRERYAPGDTVRGTILVAEDAAAESLEISLNFHERATQYESVTDTIPGDPVEIGPPAQGARPFEAALPEDAPPNYTSAHGALWWSIDARAAAPGREVLATRRFEVVASDAGPDSRAGPAALSAGIREGA